jgi:coenzyme F420-0:L-glutamate ligase
VLKEADEVISSNPWVLLTIKNGIYCANAGVDTSNVPQGYAITWPENPNESVSKLRGSLMKKYQLKELGVIMIDSICIPGRKGTISVALAGAGFGALQRLENEEDLFGNILRYSTLNIADSLATAANLVMGENTESCPVGIVRGAPVDLSKRYKNDEMIISPSEDLFQM